jgi:HPt (histidine-containing phosphotransfer) domain-containing protein
MQLPDRAKILRDLGDIPEELYNDLLKEFAEEAILKCQTLKDAALSGDLLTVERTAHSIKGASANLRVVEISEKARLLESAAKDRKDTDLFLKNIEDLLALCKDLKSLT